MSRKYSDMSYIENTSTRVSKEVLLDLLELLNEYDRRLSIGEGRASLQRQIGEYHQLLGQTLRRLQTSQ